MTLSIVPPYRDGTANPQLTDDQQHLAATALTCIQGGAGDTPHRGNAATRLMRVQNFLFAAMIRGDERVDIDTLIRIAEGDEIPDLVA
jgi:hypothetical protein